MKIFIDSATVSEIKKADSYGILDGVTTNPSLIKRAVDSLKKAGKNIDMQRYIEDILKTAKGTPVSLEVIGADADTIIAEGKALFRRFNSIANNVVIKVPVNPAFKADDTTHFDGIKAIKALSAQGIPINCTLIFTPEQAILAASLRNPRQVREAAFAGADIATLPLSVIETLLHHHKTFEGMKSFTDDIVPAYSGMLKELR